MEWGYLSRLLFAIILLVSSRAAFAAMPEKTIPDKSVEDDGRVISFVLENDLFNGTDKDYTNGVRFAFLSSEAQTPEFARWMANNLLPLSPEGNKRIGFALGQNMYTPEDKSVSGRLYEQRPYAGWLYGSIGMVSDTGKTLDNVMLTLGVVGPYSLGDETQTFVHRVIDSPKARGWGNQLKTEPGIILTFERKWRSIYEFSPFGAGFDMTPYAGMDLGNVNTNASFGTTFRLGYDLPADYGPPRIRPSLPGSDFFIPTKELGGYLFAGAEARAVARNIFLDGNTFASSQNVDKRYAVGTLQAGFAITYNATRLSYTQVFMTKEYNQQKKPQHFGALSLSYRF